MNTIWITGAGGFLADYVAAECRLKGWSVYGIGPRCRVEGASVYSGMVSDYISSRSLSALFEKSGSPDQVFHLAGSGSVGMSFKDPKKDFEKTALGTVALMDWLRKNGIAPTVVYASSAAVYGNTNCEQLREKDALCPCSPYGLHKEFAEKIILSYQKLLNNPVSVVRLFSIYGPGLKKQFIWDFSRRLATCNGTIMVQGTGREVRDWLYAEDAARLLVQAAAKAKDPGLIINGGTGDGTSIGAVASYIINVKAPRVSLQFSGTPNKNDPQRLVADCSEMTAIGFTPRTNITDGLQRVIEWMDEQLGEGG